VHDLVFLGGERLQACDRRPALGRHLLVGDVDGVVADESDVGLDARHGGHESRGVHLAMAFLGRLFRAAHALVRLLFGWRGRSGGVLLVGSRSRSARGCLGRVRAASALGKAAGVCVAGLQLRGEGLVRERLTGAGDLRGDTAPHQLLLADGPLRDELGHGRVADRRGVPPEDLPIGDAHCHREALRGHGRRREVAVLQRVVQTPAPLVVVPGGGAVHEDEDFALVAPAGHFAIPVRHLVDW